MYMRQKAHTVCTEALLSAANADLCSVVTVNGFLSTDFWGTTEPRLLTVSRILESRGSEWDALATVLVPGAGERSL